MENQNGHNINLYDTEEKNSFLQFLKKYNCQKNIKYHEIDMTTKKQNYSNHIQIKNDSHNMYELRNSKITYNVNNNNANKIFLESLRKNNENKKCRNTFYYSKFNQQNERINDNQINNFIVKEEGQKNYANSKSKNIFQNDLDSRKKYVFDNSYYKYNLNINYINDNSTKKKIISHKTNNFRNSSIQNKNLLKYPINIKEKSSKITDEKNKQIIYYKKYQRNNKFANCKIDEKISFTLPKQMEIKTFNRLEIEKSENYSFRKEERTKLLKKKLNDFFFIKRKDNIKKLLKKEACQQILINGKEKTEKKFQKDTIEQFLIEGKNEKITPKEKIKEILNRDKIGKEEIKEILREFHIFINPNIKEKNEIETNGANGNFLIKESDNIWNETDDNGINPCCIKNKNKKENVKIIEEKKKRKDLMEYQKIYGFKNEGNNCYLNSSLQLLTRIKELRDEILNIKEIYENNNTEGKLINEFRKMLVLIGNSSDNNLIINPGKLKRIMGNVDNKYFSNGQEDSNRFITNFLNALLLETGNKEMPIKRLNIINELDKKPYESLYKKFFKKKGASFVIDLFYGITKTTKNCNNCGKNNSIKFNVYNILDFKLYELAKHHSKKELTLESLYQKFLEEKKAEEDSCSFCNSDKLYIKTVIYTFPKYLIICLQRACDLEYCDNNVIYPKNMKIKGEFENIERSYILDCVIEHSGGVGFGHYTALIPIDKDNNIWWRFSDSYWNGTNIGYQSENAFILLYKLN